MAIKRIGQFNLWLASLGIAAASLLIAGCQNSQRVQWSNSHHASSGRDSQTDHAHCPECAAWIQAEQRLESVAVVEIP